MEKNSRKRITKTKEQIVRCGIYLQHLQNFCKFCRTFVELWQNFCGTFEIFAEFLEFLELLEHLELLQFLQNFWNFWNIGNFCNFWRTFAELLQIFCRIFAELLESQKFKLDKSWLSIDQSVEKCIKSIKLDKIWESDREKKGH